MTQQSIPNQTSAEADNLSQLRAHIVATKHAEEHQFVQALLNTPALDQAARDTTAEIAQELVRACRKDTRSQTLLDSFLQEFGLSNKEGVALMCLAEALLRVPDSTTADRLIAEKMTSGNWKSHSGRSESIFVNAATWGMILTGRLIQLDDEITQQPGSWLKGLSSKLSEPVVRRAILQAMRIMGGQYVLGRTIDEGIKKGAKINAAETRYSFDMLGEAARTEQDAQRYFKSYAAAFDRVGQLNTNEDVYNTDGVSVKLSALHPQYHFAHSDTVMAELLPRIIALCKKAKQYNIGLSIDAEEAARLELSLDIFEALCRHPELAQWDGLGFVMQAYQKRAPDVARWLVQLGRDTQRKLMVRLVKGAYWDAEIKHAQEQGLEDYPVFTRKVNTDACYLHCAKLLLQANDAIYPQFATHNAYTAVAILQIGANEANRDFEFQRLHGMGELLYKHLHRIPQAQAVPLRVYAPIGQHEDLLPYLVRRLLENGANSSFVNRFLDNDTPVTQLIQDVYHEVQQYPQLRHSQIPVPANLYIAAGEDRKNSNGLDLDDAQTVARIQHTFERVAAERFTAHSIISGESVVGKPVSICSPADRKRVVGDSSYADAEMIERALKVTQDYKKEWQATPVSQRAAVLNNMADLLEQNMLTLMAIINLEAGRTIPDCVSEVREAVDFCRYYALQATTGAAGQGNASGRGTFFCISPWNFPLAIFTGQIAAALVAGNCVIAKPAEQTPLVAARAIALFHEAGCPTQALQLLLGPGANIGRFVTSDARIDGIAFTGSTDTAMRINQQIAERYGETIPLIAETGGQNCMIVDSTALPEQVVDDVISSAFHSAGQRCSALRVLYVQDVIADKVLQMLEGAMRLVKVDSPNKIHTDVGPVIDQAAKENLLAHESKIEPLSESTYRVKVDPELSATGTFFAPCAHEIESLSLLDREVFGPVLHIIRYPIDELDRVIEQINATGYGLTLGVHSRIEAIANYIFRKTSVGNTYINRNTIGAVVGVNPFGGTGLSGTGPKAGGPTYLHRFQRQTDSVDSLSRTTESSAAVLKDHTFDLQVTAAQIESNSWSILSTSERCRRLRDSVRGAGFDEADSAVALLEHIAQEHKDQIMLPGPTGEENLLLRGHRGMILLCVDAGDSSELLVHVLILMLSVGNSVLVHASETESQKLAQQAIARVDRDVPADCLQTVFKPLSYDLLENELIDAVTLSSSHTALSNIRQTLSRRDGPITPLIEFDASVKQTGRVDNYLSFFYQERVKTDNLVARGGNTQLFNLNE